MKKIKEKELAIRRDSRDKIQPYRVVNLACLKPRVNNEPEILYFCKTRVEAMKFMQKEKGEL